MSQPSSLDPLFDSALSRSLDEHDRNLWRAIREQAIGGKRFRPRLLLSVFRALGGTDELSAGFVADAVELFHTTFVIHDDVIDGDQLRRGKPNVTGTFSARAIAAGAPQAQAHRYGETAGILAGDLALAGAMRNIAMCGAKPDVMSRLLDLVDLVLHRSAAGELADVRVSFTGADLSDVLNIAAWKTSAYSFELPMQAAAILAEADERVISDLGQAGRDVGIAFQLLDDLDGVFASPDQTGKDPLSDLREGKFTALMVFARSTSQWDDLSRYVGRADLTLAEAERARTLLTESGARDSVLALAGDYRRSALASAARLPGDASDVVTAAIDQILGTQASAHGVAS